MTVALKMFQNQAHAIFIQHFDETVYKKCGTSLTAAPAGHAYTAEQKQLMQYFIITYACCSYPVQSVRNATMYSVKKGLHI